MPTRIKVTRFSSTSGDVTDQVNQFLDERALELGDVVIQFVTSMVNIPFAEATISEPHGLRVLAEAFVTHPA
jgi:hypothetical protein